MIMLEKIFLLTLSLLISLNLAMAQPTAEQENGEFILVDSVLKLNMAMDNNFGIFVVWDSYPSDSVYFAKFDTLGNFLLPKRIISRSSWNISPTLSINESHIATAWEKKDFLSFNSYIEGQLLLIDGTDIGNNIRYNDVYFDAYRGGPSVSFISDSVYLVVWEGPGSETPDFHSVFGQRYSINGSFVGYNILLSDSYIYNAMCGGVKVASHQNSDKCVISWIDDRTGIRMQYARMFFKESMTAVDSSFRVNSDISDFGIRSGNIVMDSEGNFLIAYSQEIESTTFNIYYRPYSLNGVPQSPPNLVNEVPSEAYPTVNLAQGLDGSFVIVWRQKDSLNTFSTITGQRYDENGTKIGNNFPLSKREPNNYQVHPAVILKYGRIYVAWREDFNYWFNIIDFDDPSSSRLKDKYVRLNKIKLYQNYPNPFNPSTTIKLTLPKSEFVTLKVYNTLGEEVTTLITKKLRAGNHTYQFDGSNLASGFYLYRIAVGEYTDVKKMILIR